MSSFSQITPAQVLQLNLNESALDLLNAAIASHQENIQNTSMAADSTKIQRPPPAPLPMSSSNNTEDSTTSTSALSSTNNQSTERSAALKNSNESTDMDNSANAINHVKREREKDEQQTPTAPKRAGRKPIEKTPSNDVPLDPKQKRKAQNRAAQRAFRDRKEKHVAELQARIAELEASASKTEELVKENQQLKEQLQKLQEENYALKGAQFTFEFPVPNHLHTNDNTAADNYSTSSSSRQNSLNSTYQTNNSLISNTYSGTDDTGSPSSSGNSPISSSNSHSHEEDSSAETPNSLFTADPIQFGLFSSAATAKMGATNNNNSSNNNNNSLSTVNNSNDFNFMAVADPLVGFGNVNNPFDITNNQMFPTTNNLFHGKDDLFTNYSLPTSNSNNTATTGHVLNDDINNISTAAIDDFLLNNEDLALLFGPNDDLFGLTNNNSAAVTAATNQMNAQFGLPELPTTTTTSNTPTTNYKKLPLSSWTPEMKKHFIERLKESQRQGKHLQEAHKEICPDFDLDSLCADMKRKVTCTELQHPITDKIVDIYTKILDSV